VHQHGSMGSFKSALALVGGELYVYTLWRWAECHVRNGMRTDVYLVSR
jgi:hypothetical protein